MILAAYGLSKHFPVRGAFRSRTTLKAVDDADLKIDNEQIVGLVGESGSGKSTLGRCLIRLLEPTSGEVLFDIPNERLALYEKLRAKSRELGAKASDGSKPPEDASQSKGDMALVVSEHSLLQRSGGQLRQLRRHMNIVFQDPYSSLNPRLKLSEIISEPMVSTRFCTRSEARLRAQELLREVGLPEFFEDRYPHELSGGQRQRVAIARAISTKPKLLILDEPTSALDVSVQAQILNLLRQLREKYGISMLVITHNIAVVAYLAEKVYVMYAGKIMEWGDKRKVLREPEHPYTKALMSAVPIAGEQRIRTILRGDPPNLVEPPLACRFHPRCPVAFEICGWSADEVSDDLAYLLTGKYFTTFGDALTLRAIDENLVSIEGTSDAARVEQIVAHEKDEIRSMTSVDKITASEGKLLVRLRSRVDPDLYPLPDGREVNCLLFRPLIQEGMGSATIRGQ